jgi:hypothetical protein
MKGSGAMRPSSMFYVHEADVVQVHHFLDQCSLCAKSLSGDIFMYRSDGWPYPVLLTRFLEFQGQKTPAPICIAKRHPPNTFQPPNTYVRYRVTCAFCVQR